MSAAGIEAEPSLVCHFELPDRSGQPGQTPVRHSRPWFHISRRIWRLLQVHCPQCMQDFMLSLSDTAHHRMCVPISGTADSMLSLHVDSIPAPTKPPFIADGGVHLLKGHGDCQ